MKINKEKVPARNFNLTSFKKATKEIINLNNSTYLEYLLDRRKKLSLKNYKPDEIENIINSGNSREQQKLSRNYFCKDGIYKEIILYYASLLKNTGLLIPTPRFDTKLSKKNIQSKTYKALEFIDNLNLPVMASDIYLKILRDGAYYAVKKFTSEKDFVLLELPSLYCSSKYKNLQGKDVIDFDLTYFDSITDKQTKNILLTKGYPKIFLKAYNQYKKGIITNLFSIPTDISVYLSLTEDARPPFLDVIQASIDYDEAVLNHKEKEAEEIKRIIVNEIPHLNDGTLVFEPEEAAEMHEGICDMVKTNPNVSVITSYGKISSIDSKTVDGTHKNNLEPMIDNIYLRAGVTKQIFGCAGNSSVDKSVENDISLMMTLANKLAIIITEVVNTFFSKGDLSFRYKFLPVSLYNEDEYITSTFKLTASGYSYLIPAAALGFSQREFVNLKDMENDILDLETRMIPLKSSFQSSGDNSGAGAAEVGAPKKSPEEAAPKTLQNQESLDKQGV